jgi:glutaredoxin-related protein
MKLTVVGNHFCPDTIDALKILNDQNLPYEFIDVAGHPEGLKIFIHIRETSPLYDAVRQKGMVGVPYFKFDDDFETLDIQEALKHFD